MIKIVQPLNNNVVMGYDRKKGEVIIIGTGIGFRAKKVIRLMKVKFKKCLLQEKINNYWK
ncbi:CAT RNA binding domain-containing protein [[Ruminococcus] torques]|uniref:CAT RNA binding domain protein n=1 Tax=[Ruminococcus] torques ATCC 27756 TaxID=411460 RepID=A5KQH0_9FIRM|nr:CAT RNA binding domain-containing protein [[Ruminococcus] torques]EDK23360.1 CAT RNA binding domain protein [[Ruminococcus] torques ATCC 27756]